MHDALAARLQFAVKQIATPEVPLTAIVTRADERRKRSKVRAIAFGIGLTLASAGAAAAFGTGFLNGARIWLSGDRAGATVSSLAIVNAPTAADMRRLLRRATFPVVLPVSLSSGTRLTVVRFSPAAHPNVIDLEYVNERAKEHFGVVLFDSSAVAKAGDRPKTMQQSYIWQVGSESVGIIKRWMKPGDAGRIREAMINSDPHTSLAASVPLLPKATILGNARGSYKIAARYGSPDGSSVLIEGPALMSIPSLAKRHQPLLDSRTVYLTNVPTVNHEPEYAKATLSWPQTVVIKAAGVRAIHVVLRSLGAAAPRVSGVLFNEAAPYRVMVIEGSLLAPNVRTFRVDPITFRMRETSEH